MAKKEAAEKGEPEVVAKCDNLYEVSQNHNNLLASVTQSDIEFPKEMHDMFQKIAEHHNAQFRLCKTLVAGFKATNEQDLSYMDGYMDTLFDFMDPGGDTEALYREYLAHVATFNPQKAKEYEESLDEHLGYKIHVVFAAAYVARELHHGQKDKGGNDYFSSHLLPVGKSGHDWKEQVVGLLHDAAEDTTNDISTIIHLVKSKLETWMNNPGDRSWIDDFEKDFFQYPAEQCHVPTEEEWGEIAAALQLLNHHTAPNREEYLSRICTNMLALKVKLNDLRSNMDVRRIAEPTEKDMERLERYKKEYERLMNAFQEQINKEDWTYRA